MKKIILSTISCCFLIGVLAQDSAYKQVQPLVYGVGIHTKPAKNSRDYFLQRSEKEKNGASVLMGVGVLFSAVGWIWYEQVVNKDYTLDEYEDGTAMAVTTSHTLAIGGLCMIAGSIPLFILAGHDRKKAGTLSVNFKVESYKSIGLKSTGINAYPALGLVIHL
jgi:hypothetical protein